MKLTELQKHKLSAARDDMTTVLNEIKRKPLKGKSLQFMKDLEGAVQVMECLTVITHFTK